MPSLHEVQKQFAHALFAGTDDEIEHAVVPGALGVALRLDIYRNNVLSNYRKALRDTYPTIVRLVGDEFFNAAARVFAKESVSGSGDLHDYGEAFGDFLAAFEPARGLPYLGDVARLEWAMHRVFHAADATALTPSGFSALSEEQLTRLRFILHPAARLIESRYPIARIWRISQPENSDEEVSVSLDEGGERVLVIRRNDVVELEPLTKAQYAMLYALAHEAPLGEAVEVAMRQDATFDLGQFLTHHVTRATFVAIQL